VTGSKSHKGTYSRIDLSRYIVLPVWNECNNNCTICMLSGLKQKMPPISFSNFRQLINDIVEDKKFDNLILSGAEVTTFDDLERYIRYAYSTGWFKKIQIQTNGRKLCDKEYLKRIIDSGVNEFFLSLHGREAVHDEITRSRGSFIETLKGIQNLELFDVNVITNTVLTRFNYDEVVPLMVLVSQTSVSEMQLWNYFPMEKGDSNDFIVSMGDFCDLLPGLFSGISSSGKAVVLKSFPECLSIGEPGFFDSLHPATILPDFFWKTFDESNFGLCCHRGPCKSKTCWGLSNAYIQKYGDERQLLSPFK